MVEMHLPPDYPIMILFAHSYQGRSFSNKTPSCLCKTSMLLSKGTIPFANARPNAATTGHTQLQSICTITQTQTSEKINSM